MAELRRQGLTFGEIGTRQGLSERTARRYVGRVEPRLTLPQRDDPEPVADPAALREGFAREFMEILYREPRLNRLYVTKRANVGHLYSDYVGWHQFSQNFGETGEDWRPRHERPSIEPVDDLAEDEDLL